MERRLKKASQRREADYKCRYKYSKNKTIEETQERQFIIATVISVISLILGCGALLFEILY